MPRGQKTCHKCKKATGPRAGQCPNCGQKFSFAAKKHIQDKIVKEHADFDWRQLQKGEYIKSVSGYGPFYPMTDEVTGEFVAAPMGHYGVFVVAFVGKDGIGTYEVQKDSNGGFCYIYMGEEKLSTVTNTVLRPHKICRIIRRRR